MVLRRISYCSFRLAVRMGPGSDSSAPGRDEIGRKANITSSKREKQQGRQGKADNRSGIFRPNELQKI